MTSDQTLEITGQKLGCLSSVFSYLQFETCFLHPVWYRGYVFFSTEVTLNCVNSQTFL